jgi:hypothetical protein
MPPAGFEPTIQASERRLTYALDRAPSGIGQLLSKMSQITASTCTQYRILHARYQSYKKSVLLRSTLLRPD